MKLNPATLSAIGRALYGPSWQKPLSIALTVNDRTLRRWLNGDFDIPQGVWPELVTLCRERGTELASWAEKLS